MAKNLEEREDKKSKKWRKIEKNIDQKNDEKSAENKNNGEKSTGNFFKKIDKKVGGDGGKSRKKRTEK